MQLVSADHEIEGIQEYLNPPGGQAGGLSVQASNFSARSKGQDRRWQAKNPARRGTLRRHAGSGQHPLDLLEDLEIIVTVDNDRDVPGRPPAHEIADREDGSYEHQCDQAKSDPRGDAIP